MKKLLIPLLVLIILGELTILFLPIKNGIFYFTFDQARDAIWVKNQIDFHKPSLIGPWGSLTGVFFGPLWFWLLAIPYLISGGDPTALTLFNGLFIVSTIILSAFLFKRYSFKTSLFILLLSFSSLSLHDIAGTAFSQHLLPLLTMGLVFSLAQILYKPKPVYIYIAFFCVSLMFHAEPPLFLFSLIPTAFIMYLSFRKKRETFSPKTIILSLIFFLLPFFPTILFELKHDFLQFKAVLAYLMGQNKSLGDILPFYLRLIDRPLKFFAMYKYSLINQEIIAFGILILTLWSNLKKVKNLFLKSFWHASVIYICILLIIFIIYPPELKLFYLDGLPLIFITLTSIALSEAFYKKRILVYLILLFVLSAFFINKKPLAFYSSLNQNFKNKQTDTSIFKNQKDVVDWIYTSAQGQGFKVYTYQPAVYDYPYQYLFLWYGLNTYGYLPEEFSYLPKKPEYVQFKERQIEKLKDKIRKSDGLFFLIIEVEKEMYKDRLASWKKSLPLENSVEIEKTVFPDKTIVEKRIYQK